MGLDMHLTGLKIKKEDCKELGYFRDRVLHDYITDKFSNSIETQTLELSGDELEDILNDILDNYLDVQNFDETVKFLQEAIKWINENEEGYEKKIIYTASW